MFQISESENLKIETSYENEIYQNMIRIYEQQKKKKKVLRKNASDKKKGKEE